MIEEEELLLTQSQDDTMMAESEEYKKVYENASMQVQKQYNLISKSVRANSTKKYVA